VVLLGAALVLDLRVLYRVLGWLAVEAMIWSTVLQKREVGIPAAAEEGVARGVEDGVEEGCSGGVEVCGVGVGGVCDSWREGIEHGEKDCGDNGVDGGGRGSGVSVVRSVSESEKIRRGERVEINSSEFITVHYLTYQGSYLRLSSLVFLVWWS
jgi:hypothetical protein